MKTQGWKHAQKRPKLSPLINSGSVQAGHKSSVTEVIWTSTERGPHQSQSAKIERLLLFDWLISSRRLRKSQSKQTIKLTEKRPKYPHITKNTHFKKSVQKSH